MVSGLSDNGKYPNSNYTGNGSRIFSKTSRNIVYDTKLCPGPGFLNIF